MNNLKYEYNIVAKINNEVIVFDTYTLNVFTDTLTKNRLNIFLKYFIFMILSI